MCPAHRKAVLAEVRQHLKDGKPTLCVSTQLIEAGVDVDFGSVIRFTAGLDSIAQAAGRCNRNQKTAVRYVHVVNPRPEEENLDKLPDIRIGREAAERVLDDFEADPARFDKDRIGPKAMAWYYRNYFFDRATDMDYPVPATVLGHDDTLLELLSRNSQAQAEHARKWGQAPNLYLRQSFMAAARTFKAIDAPTRGVVVPHGEEGRKVIGELCSAFLPDQERGLLRRAQQFTVNVFPHVLEWLDRKELVRETQPGTGILYLIDRRYYSPVFGLGKTPEGTMENLNV
jgi:CRISPR-associated endonuclease/helicase Cas3